ncbi:MAG: peptide ABC transporter substrate-binding protein [Treponema sp.]|jgi:peptide/nickel transport system substrate-binding protein|nr:peptide ABC transporter substrate-binding protein [Treponema sp.]
MKKSLFLFCAVLLLAGFSGPLSAKGNSQGAAAGQGTPVSGGTLIIGDRVLDTQLAAKNPFLPQNTDETIIQFMYEPLFYFNYVQGTLEPELASGYEWSSDYKTLTITVRSGVQWHDGRPFTAEDVAFTYNTLKKEPVLDRYSLWNKLSSVTAQGDQVVFSLSQPFPSLPYYTNSIYIVPKHIWEAWPSAAEALNQVPVGTGPFKWESYRTGTDVQLSANKSYWYGAPKLDRILIQMYTSSANSALAFLRGDVDTIIGGLSSQYIPQILQRPNAKIQMYSSLFNFVVSINLENELLSDINVRKAMRLAMNVEEINTRGEYGTAVALGPGWLPFIFGDLVSESSKKPLVFDPAAAQKILTDAGYTKGQDGIFQKNGKRLSFTYHNASGSPSQQMQAGMIQQYLLGIGIEIIPRQATAPELVQLHRTGRFNLLQTGTVFPPDPFASLNTSFHSSMTAPTGQAAVGNNFFRFRNREVDSLLDQAASETDQAKQQQIYHRIQDILVEEVPFLPMYTTTGKSPYYENVRLGGFISDAPVFCYRGLTQLYQIK